MVNPWYTTREAVKAALDVKETARNNAQIDRCIEAASRAVEGALHRKFYPWLGTRYFNWPTRDNAGYTLRLDEHELISLTAITSAGTALTSSQYFLEPINSGPPFRTIEVNLGTNAFFTSGGTWQRNIAITGLWGYDLSELLCGATVEAMDASETGVDVNGAASAFLGVGSVIKVDDERMIVIGRSQLDTGVNISGNVTDNQSTTTIPVGDGTAFATGEVILIDAEKMLIVDIAGNNLIVKRAWDGSTRADHTSGADVYSARTLTVQRGSLGTTAATHLTSANVYVWQPPGLVEELCMAYALTNLSQRQAGYARTVGTGDAVRESAGRGLDQIKQEAVKAHGRNIIHMAV